MGMVALVQVGKPVNLDAVKAFVVTGAAKKTPRRRVGAGSAVNGIEFGRTLSWKG